MRKRKPWKINPDRNIELGLAILRNTTLIYDDDGLPCAFKWVEKPENPEDEEWRREAGMQPGDISKFREMAALCGVTRQNMSLLFEKAMRKVRRAMDTDKEIEKELREFLEVKRLH